MTPDGRLWLGSDELPTVERLSQTAPCVFGEHRRFHLGEFVALSGGEREVDIEGLGYADHAEDLACLPCLGEPAALMIVYGSPHPARVAGPGRVFADIFKLPV